MHRRGEPSLRVCVCISKNVNIEGQAVASLLSNDDEHAENNNNISMGLAQARPNYCCLVCPLL